LKVSNGRDVQLHRLIGGFGPGWNRGVVHRDATWPPEIRDDAKPQIGAIGVSAAYRPTIPYFRLFGPVQNPIVNAQSAGTHKIRDEQWIYLRAVQSRTADGAFEVGPVDVSPRNGNATSCVDVWNGQFRHAAAVGGCPIYAYGFAVRFQTWPKQLGAKARQATRVIVCLQELGLYVSAIERRSPNAPLIIFDEIGADPVDM
jgi:hypothetical protein